VPALLLGLAGFAGLLHEVVWARWFATVYGGTAPAAAAVLAAYLGGLAAGAAWLGRAGDRSASPRRLFALFQLGTALCGAALILVPAALPSLYAAMVPAGSGGLVVGAARFALAALFLLAPAFLMGGSLPVAARWAAAGREGSAARLAGRLRAANCLGAAAGALLAAWLLIPWLGLRLTVLSAAGLNLLAAALAFFLARDPSVADQPAKRAARPGGEPGRTVPWPAALALASFAGALALGTELAQMRAVAFFTSSTIYSFATVSAVYIAALGIGALLGGWLIRKPAALTAAPALAVLLAAAGAFTGISVPVLAALGPGSGSLALAAAGCTPGALALGAAFPLLVHLLSPAPGRIGRAVGGAVAALELGSVAGPVAGALVLLPLLGTKWTLLLLGATAVLVALVLAAWAARAGARLAPAGRLLVILALPVAVLPGLRTEIYGLAAQRQDSLGTEPVLEVQREDPEAVVSVVTGYEPPEARRVTRIFVGRKMQAEDVTPWLRVEKRMGALPALLGPKTGGRALHVGLGSGVTASWSAAVAPGRAVECAELVPAVPGELGHFRPHNSAGNFTISVGDGRTRLLQERGKFELIVTDIVFPEDAGAGGLFSAEYFRLARSRLADGGAFAQWLPLFQIPPEGLKATVRGFREVFPDATLWAGCLDAHRPVAMLLGVKGGGARLLDREALAARIKASGLSAEQLAELGLGSPEAVLSRLIAGPEKLGKLDCRGPAGTDDRPLVELRAHQRDSDWAVQNMEFILNELWDWEAPPGFQEDARRLRLARRRLAEGCFKVMSPGGAEAGLAKLRQARELDGADPEAAYALWDSLATLASQALRAGEAEQARQWLEESLKHGPARDYILHDLAKALTALDRTKEALARAREATRLGPWEPNNWDLLEKMAHNAREAGESERAGRKAAELRASRGRPAQPAVPVRGKGGS